MDDDVSSRIPPTHPGEILREEFLEPLGLSAYALARALGVSRPTVNDVVRERRGISTGLALRLGRYFGNSAEMWMNLQIRYDLRVARIELRDELAPIEPYSQATPPHTAEQERILCAAVWINDGVARRHQGMPTGIVVTGHRHSQCLEIAAELSIGTEAERAGKQQGFLTNRGRFVGRTLAAEIAEAAGQLKGRHIHINGHLTSEDLY